MNPQDFIREILRFSGHQIDTETIETLPYSIKETKPLSGFGAAFKRRLNPIIADRDRINPRVLFPVRGAGKKIVSYLRTFDAITPQPFKDVFDRKLRATISGLVGDRYKHSNNLTAQMLNLNLAAYGYDVTQQSEKEVSVK